MKLYRVSSIEYQEIFLLLFPVLNTQYLILNTKNGIRISHRLGRIF